MYVKNDQGHSDDDDGNSDPTKRLVIPKGRWWCWLDLWIINMCDLMNHICWEVHGLSYTPGKSRIISECGLITHIRWEVHEPNYIPLLYQKMMTPKGGGDTSWTLRLSKDGA